MDTLFTSKLQLLDFDSLLIKGPYPKSLPIALAIGHLQKDFDAAEGRSSDVLLLTPSREAFAAALQEYNDTWMNSKLSTGGCVSLLARIRVYYPPSPAHWHLLLSLLAHVDDNSGLEGGAPDKIILRRPVSLIIIHEPSAYFSDSVSDVDEALHSKPTLSEYLRVVTSSLSCAKHLSAPNDPIPLVLFDSVLNDFKLPIVSQLPESPARRLFQQQRSGDAVERKEIVLRFVEKYFGWVGSVVDESSRGKEDSAHSQASPANKSGLFHFRIERRILDEDMDVDDASMPHIERWTVKSKDPRPFSVLYQTLVEDVKKAS